MSQKSQNKVAESTSRWLNNICLFTFLAFITLLAAWVHFVLLYLHLVDSRFLQIFFVLSNICTLISFAPRTLQRPQENFCCLYSLFLTKSVLDGVLCCTVVPSPRHWVHGQGVDFLLVKRSFVHLLLYSTEKWESGICNQPFNKILLDQKQHLLHLLIGNCFCF